MGSFLLNFWGLEGQKKKKKKKGTREMIYWSAVKGVAPNPQPFVGLN
jgi:hypothetical protein